MHVSIYRERGKRERERETFLVYSLTIEQEEEMSRSEIL
jgi:hypothetical protein